jgi:hypothetical protein
LHGAYPDAVGLSLHDQGPTGMNRLNILVLHSLGDPETSPHFLRNHVFSLKTYSPEHNYVFHDTALPLPNYVRDTVFDAIILDVTFLCMRWAPAEYFLSLKNSYDFVKFSSAAKIAFPQDEYDCHELLDDWMCDWRVDVVFSVISSGWDILYPRYHKLGDIRLGYTGYVDKSLIGMERKPFDQRCVDIGYRARKLPPYFGRIGETKWTIGRDVALQCRHTGLNADIVLGDHGTLYGRAWLDFINNCKFTLGTNSGSSLLDPRGDIQRNVRAYLEKYPKASFEEVEEHCFKGLDGHYAFTAISPRVLEAAILNSCQILVEGAYSGLIQPWEHYIPIRQDASNFNDVLIAMQDRSLVAQLINNCRSAILDKEDLRYKNRTRKIIELIEKKAARKRPASNCDAVKKAALRYADEMAPKYQRYWRQQAFRRRLARLVEGCSPMARFVRSARKAFRSDH